MTSPLIQDFVHFLNQSPTSYHACASMIQSLKEKGYHELLEKEGKWALKQRNKYWLTRNGASLCIFHLPRKTPRRALIFAAHTDSPSFRLKPHAEIRRQNALLWGLEVYGGPLLNSWLNRELGLAGRVYSRDSKGKVREDLVLLDEYPLILPQLAIHLDAEVNSKGLVLGKQDQLYALAALSPPLSQGKSYLETVLAEKLKGKRHILSHDLFLYPLQPPSFVGWKQQLLSSYRIDNLASVHAAFNALLELPCLDDTLLMSVFWDHEEIGSSTAQGAASPFFEDTLERICLQQGLCREEYLALRTQSTCLSLDMAHTTHPCYEGKSEPQHRIHFDAGPVIKVNAQQRYCTEARLQAWVQDVAARQKIPLQLFVSHNDLRTGSTIGPIHASRTGIPTLDMGHAQLSMHSARELLSCQDHVFLHALLKSLVQHC